MENAKAIDTDKYTDETVKVFKESLSIAEDVLADEEATEAEVSEAAARLANAIKQLEEKDTPTDPDDGDKPDDGNKPGRHGAVFCGFCECSINALQPERNYSGGSGFSKYPY